jgi:RimJ/RimL family protein N-acetyltransferase
MAGIVPTLDSHLPELWDIARQWPQFWEGEMFDTYEQFVVWMKVVVMDSLTAEIDPTIKENYRIVGFGCLDNVFEPSYATVIIMRNPAWIGGLDLFVKLCRDGLKMFFQRHNVEIIRGFTRTSHPATSRLVEALGFTFEGTLRRWKKIDGIWTDFRSYSIARNEL